MEEFDPESPRRSGGPATPEGKARSSQNAFQHGCRSKTKILPNENQEDFDVLCGRWMAEFQPENEADGHFVEQVVLNDWFLQRVLKRYNAVETELADIDFTNWTDAQHKKMQLALRYKGEAERALNRSLRAADVWRRNRNQEVRQRHLDDARAQSQLLASERRIFKEIQAEREDAWQSRAETEKKLRTAELKYGLDVSKQRAAVERIWAEQDACWKKILSDLGADDPPPSSDDSSQPDPF